MALSELELCRKREQHAADRRERREILQRHPRAKYVGFMEGRRTKAVSYAIDKFVQKISGAEKVGWLTKAKNAVRKIFNRRTP